jgi:hypothetical protein
MKTYQNSPPKTTRATKSTRKAIRGAGRPPSFGSPCPEGFGEPVFLTRSGGPEDSGGPDDPEDPEDPEDPASWAGSVPSELLDSKTKGFRDRLLTE